MLRLAGVGLGMLGCGCALYWYARYVKFSRMHIVWDLDRTLIVSETLERELPAEQAVTVLATDADGRGIEHVDDDCIRFHTVMRPWASFVLRFLHVMGAKQYVYTAATDGYMRNVCSMLDAHGTLFVDHLSITQTPNLVSVGKRIRLFEERTRGQHAGFAYEHALLVDDGLRYHKAQPQQGILCTPTTYADAKAGTLMIRGDGGDMSVVVKDRELLRVLWVIIRCAWSGLPVSEVLPGYAPPAYRERYLQ